MKKKILSKSQANTFIQCPLKWKFMYIDKLPSPPFPAMERGTRIHNKIENFYKKNNIHKRLDEVKDEELKNFVEFEKERLKGMDEKYFYPIFQELKMTNVELGLKGIVDAVYINQDDEKLIVIDYKSGKYYKNKFDDYRFELAVYAELLKHSGKIDKEIGYIGIMFVDQKKLFFEKLDNETIRRMYEIIEKVRADIQRYTETNNFPKKPHFFCKWCQFRERCRSYPDV